MHRTLKRPSLAALLLLGILAFQSCTRPDQQIGLSIQPEEDLLAANQTDTISLTARTYTIDSLRTDDLLYTLLGNYIDPELGGAQLDLYTQVRLSSNNVDFGDSDNIFIDSLVLAFKYEGFQTGLLRPQTFEVYEIEDDFIRDSSYYNHHKLATFPDNLIDPARSTVDPVIHEGFFLGEDSVSAQLRLHLDTNYAREKFLSQSGLETMADNDAFLEYLEGFLIRSTSPDGAVFSFDMVDANTNLTMYYRDENGDEADTTSFIFNINDLCSRYYQSNWSRANGLAGMSPEGDLEANPYVYAQGSGNVATRIEFPFLEDLNEIENLVINKAELVIPVKDGSQFRFAPPGQIYLRRPVDEGSGTALMPEDLVPNFDPGGIYDAVNQEYRFNVSRFIQQALTGDIDEIAILLMIEDRYALANTFVNPSVNRVVLHGPSVDPDDPSKNMRLILTHTH